MARPKAEPTKTINIPISTFESIEPYRKWVEDTQGYTPTIKQSLTALIKKGLDGVPQKYHHQAVYDGEGKDESE